VIYIVFISISCILSTDQNKRGSVKIISLKMIIYPTYIETSCVCYLFHCWLWCKYSRNQRFQNHNCCRNCSMYCQRDDCITFSKNGSG